MNMKKKIARLIIFLLILSAISFSAFKMFQKKADSAVIENSILVKTQPVEIKKIPQIISAVGTLTAPEQTDISAESDGYVKRVLFQGGEYVKQGDVLLMLDDVKAKADLLSATAAYDAAQSKYKRALTLQNKGFISKQDIDLMSSDVQNQLAKKEEAQDSLNKKSIRAPFSGYLGKRELNVGDYITSGKKLVELVNRQQLKMDYSLSEEVLNFLKVGQPVDVTVDSMPDKKFEGHVSFISPTIDPKTHTVELQATIPNPHNFLAPGLFAVVKQTIHQQQTVWFVPEESLVKTPEKTVVFTVVDGKAKSVSVKTGELVDGRVMILSGLSSKDIIVTEGQAQLHDGDVIKMINQDKQ